jgi:hypothetical protein
MEHKMNEVYHVHHRQDIPVYFLANTLKDMGFRVHVHSGGNVDNVWSNCGNKVAKALLGLVYEHITYEVIDDGEECEKYIRIEEEESQGGK